jgi:hypothetical protein
LPVKDHRLDPVTWRNVGINDNDLVASPCGVVRLFIQVAIMIFIS